MKKGRDMGLFKAIFGGVSTAPRKKVCDICNTVLRPDQGSKIKANHFHFLLNNGFGIPDSNIAILTSSGMSPDQAINLLRKQYMASTSDWLLCPKCAVEAERTLSAIKKRRIDQSTVNVSKTAHDVGLGFKMVGAPVALTRRVWVSCVEWTDDDNEKQCYQEQDARLWDVLFTAGGTLQFEVEKFLRAGDNRTHLYSIYCIPRDGKSSEAVNVNLIIKSIIVQNDYWLLIDFE
jgi:hypothetical protein